MPLSGILSFFKRKPAQRTHVTPEERRRAEMAELGLDAHEQDAAFKLMEQISKGSRKERKEATEALHLLVEAARLRQENTPRSH